MTKSKPILTLAIDIGGTHLKAGVLDPDGAMVAQAERIETPAPATPAAVLEGLTTLAQHLPAYGRIAIGFPGVVRRGLVLTAPNLGTEDWRGYPLAAAVAEKLGKPARMLNDAEVQGLGVIEGKGLECVITLGTGMGFALFEDGRPAPHLELSQHPVRKDVTYDHYIGDAALKDIGKKKWNKRVQRALGWITTLVGYDTLYIGGGNSRNVEFELPPNVRLVSNEAGITGGVRLWSPALDGSFG